MRSPTDKERVLASALLLVVLVAVLYGRNLDYGFVYDDYAVAGANSLIEDLSNLPLILTADYFERAGESTYRPVTTLTYFLDHRIWGGEAFGFNFTGMLLHMVNSILVLLLARRIFRGALAPSILSAALFAVHPAAVEAVVSEGNREELLSVLFCIGSLVIYIRSGESGNRFGRAVLLSGSLLVFGAGLFAMEMIVTLPALILLYEIVNPSNEGVRDIFKKFLAGVLPFALIAGVFIALRFTVLTGTGGARGFPGGGRIQALFTMTPVFLEYLRLLLFPVFLHPEYEVPIRTNLLDARVLVSAAVLLVLGLATLRALLGRRPVAFPLAFVPIALLPVSQVIVPFWILMAERYLYLPLAGGCLLAGFAYAAVAKPGRLSVRAPAVLFVIVLLGAGTAFRIGFWKDDQTLWTDAVAKAPTAERARFNLGIQYLRQWKLEDAREQFEVVLWHHPDSVSSLVRIGLIRIRQKDFEGARNVLEQALAKEPDDADVLLHMGHTYAAAGDFTEAAIWYKRALKADFNFVIAHESLAGAALITGDRKMALIHAREALVRDPRSTQAYETLAHLAATAGRTKDAVRIYAELCRITDDRKLREVTLFNIRRLVREGR